MLSICFLFEQTKMPAGPDDGKSSQLISHLEREAFNIYNDPFTGTKTLS